jgi:hypothetical protein
VKTWKVQKGLISILVVVDVGLMSLLLSKRACTAEEKGKSEERGTETVVGFGCKSLTVDNNDSILLNF